MNLDPAKSPTRSFLHKIDDRRVVSYFDARSEEKLLVEEVENLRSLFADDPEDPYLAVHAIDVEARFGDIDRAVGLMEKW